MKRPPPLSTTLTVPLQAIPVKEHLAVGTPRQIPAAMAQLAEGGGFSEVSGLEEVLCVVGFAGLGDVAFDCEVED